MLQLKNFHFAQYTRRTLLQYAKTKQILTSSDNTETAHAHCQGVTFNRVQIPDYLWS